MKNRLRQAKEKLIGEGLSCVIMIDGNSPICSGAIGIKPLMQELRRDRQAFAGGVIADKVVGKAAALLAVLGGAEAVYGCVMSRTAVEVLTNHHIYYEYDSSVPFIENRTRTGKCPMEAAVWEIEEPALAFDVLEETIAQLMADSPFKKEKFGV